MRLCLFIFAFGIITLTQAQFTWRWQWEGGDRNSTGVKVTFKNHTTDSAAFVSFVDSFIQNDAKSFPLNPDSAGVFFSDPDSILFKMRRYKYHDYGLWDSVELMHGSAFSLHFLNVNDSGWFPGLHFVLPIYFDLDESELRPEAKAVLNDLIKMLDHKPGLEIQIGVHADERCSPMLSTCLTCRRADSIKYYLVQQGFAEIRIVAKGHQGFKPFIKNARTEEEHRMNRMVRVTVLKV